jgi:hypothetical protein
VGPAELHWKTHTLVGLAAGRPFAWVDDEITDVDRYRVSAHHPGRALLHGVDPEHGLTEADLAAMPGANRGTGSQTLSLPARLRASTAQVMFENRTVPINGGQFTESFAAEYSYHIHKITP